jgi:translation initiation factor IF-2
MVKKRVHELAKELNIESRDIISQLNQMGINVKSHMSTLEDSEVQSLVRHYEKSTSTGEKLSSVKSQPAVTPKQAATPATLTDPKGETSPGVKEPVSGKTKKTEKGKGTQSGAKREYHGTRTDHYKGPGLVDRVPSRPPDRRFQEKPKQPEKSARPWGQPRGAEQKSKAKPPGSVGEHTTLDKPRTERLPQARRETEAKPSFKEIVGQDRTSQGKPDEGRQHQERATQGRSPKSTVATGTAQRYPRPDRGASPRPQEQRQGGPAKQVAVPREGTPSALKPSRMGERAPGSATGEKMRPLERRASDAPGQTAKPRAAQVALKPHQDDKARPVDKTKTTATKTLKPGAQRPAPKGGRSEKRGAIAAHAEGRLRSKASQGRKKGTSRSQASFQKPAQPIEKKPIVLGVGTTVQELALKMHRSPAELIKKLMQLGVMATINQEIDNDTATILAGEFGYEVEIKLPVDIEAVLMQEPEEEPAQLQPRPCVVTVMGHVDHGKTSLLDAIRETNVIATEAGGITQHIGAYQVEHTGRKITFVDTPGHEAFTAMRARGAQVTDIAILVVAADDGVMPQTVEAINHAKEANVPIIVAINKTDKPGANAERVKQELTEHNLVPEEWGGETICANVSALKREGLKELLEMILLLAEVSEFKANPNRPARGTVIEAELDKGRGPVASVLVQNGTLNVGDMIMAGPAFGRVRAMMDDKGQRVKKAGPSTPVEVLGFSEVPQAGDTFIVVEDEKLARHIAARRQTKKREDELKTNTRVSLEDLFKHIKEGQIKELGIIVKADVQGSVEALRQSLERLNTGEVKVNIIHGGVGAITETDIMLASASNAIILGFNVRPDVNARKAAENEKVDVRLYRVIYDAIEDVKAAMSGLLDPEYREVTLGRAEIRKIFKASRIGTIAGCYVVEGKIERDAGVRVVRDGIVVHEGKLDSLKRFKDDVKEVVQGYECGLALEKYNEIQEGDIIEVFTIEAVKRELS